MQQDEKWVEGVKEEAVRIRLISWWQRCMENALTDREIRRL